MTFLPGRPPQTQLEQPKESVSSWLSRIHPPSNQIISVVVPVRDNQIGADNICRWWNNLTDDARPLELTFVDDGSRVPVRASGRSVHIIRVAHQGPAAARNVGWRVSKGEWIAFLDSDCIPDPGWPAAFALNWEHSIGIQGRVRASGSDLFSRFYEQRQILKPMLWSEDDRPGYLITANTLVHRDALQKLHGFCERFPLAAGEDVDLGLRLAALGCLSWSAEACVAHDFEPSLRAFVKRFFRYGRGNRMLSRIHRQAMQDFFLPRFAPSNSRSAPHNALATISFACLWLGWHFENFINEGAS